ncbi:threonylcarbamoyl-AMP synthase [Rhizobium sp. P40RR-XXII]|uniref:L-threonylcarbamoyladenylate synthase n=1 Tax=unclassified Rhizobium TaxID=2613769 RepID=UPI0014577A9A|nr:MULTISPECIES: L-threonylcarbamoyladenylate synthase [unclassified Rhizobium]NLR87097.1 threonylcarbamoyl-AMP synthase [Rhizobium sp. P28RR-XV]NLS17882.1 threonylcarbamoyl-AMP synthase [Rhizobium sp. P40RR-XXII]
MARHIDILEHPQTAIEVATVTLAEGLPIGLPTETVYGLAADATNPTAITRIYETKGRPRFNPLICHMSDLAMAERYAVFDLVSRKLAEAFWPGPLTLVLPLRPDSGIHPLATAGLDTVGIRVPQGFAGELIRAFDRPLAAPSANTSGKISATSADHVDDDLGERITLILDAGASIVGVESTIVKVEDGELRLLRPGGLAASEIERVAGKPLKRRKKASAAIEAPGMLASHYAPGAAVRLDATDVSANETLIRFGTPEIAGIDKAVAVLDLSATGDLSEAAANLFDFMKRADATGAATIAFSHIPDEGLGEAINDRLRRAAAPRE